MEYFRLAGHLAVAIRNSPTADGVFECTGPPLSREKHALSDLLLYMPYLRKRYLGASRVNSNLMNHVHLLNFAQLFNLTPLNF